MKKLIFAILLIALMAAPLLAGGGAEEADGVVAPGELGSEENPIVWALVPSGETEEIISGGSEMARLLNEKTGYFFDIVVATAYQGVIEAMATEPPLAQMASLATFSYLVAAELGVAEAALVATRFGGPTYNGQIIVRADSGIESVADLAGKTFGRSDALSTSGWIAPSIAMRVAGIDPDSDIEVLDTGGHSSTVSAVYAGDVDAGGTWVDARGTIEDEFADVEEVVTVIAVSDPIPNDGVQFHPSIPAEMSEAIIAAFLEIAETDEGVEALGIAYNWDGFVLADDSFYDPFRQVLQRAGVSASDF